MAFIKNQPTNFNILSQQKFKFLLRKVPNVTFFAQKVNLPGVEISNITIPTRLNHFNMPGSELNYSALSVEFLVDEDLANWKEIFNWIIDLSFPQSHSQYKYGNDALGMFSDASLIVMDNNYNPTFNFTFHNCYPSSISNIGFDTAVSEETPITATAIFEYDYYTLDDL